MGTKNLTGWRLLRTADADLNPQAVDQRAKAFAGSIPARGSVTLLVHRTDDGQDGYLLTSDVASANTTAISLSHAVGARVVAADAETIDLDADHMVAGELVVERKPGVVAESMVNVDPSEIARELANIMPTGSWIAATLRAPKRRETHRWADWLNHHRGTVTASDPSLGQNALVVSVRAATDSAPTTAALLSNLRGIIPGVRVRLNHRVLSSTRAALIRLIPAPILALATFATNTIGASTAVTATLIAAIFATVVFAAATAAGLAPHRGSRMLNAASRLEFAPGPTRSGRPRPPRPARPATETKSERKAHPGDYPLARTTVMMGPASLVGIVAPTAGAISGASTTKSRAVPGIVTRPIGPRFATSETGQGIYLSALDSRLGVAITGSANSGKTALVRSLWSWAVLERVDPSARPGHPGKANALIAFESKGDGAPIYTRIASELGDNSLRLIEVADPNSPAIDLMAVPGTLADKARVFVGALRYHFGDSDIGHRAYQSLIAVFTGALAVDDEVRSQLPGLTQDSPIYYAYVLLGGEGDQAAVDMASAIRHTAESTGDADLLAGSRALSGLFESATASQRRTLTESSLNKVFQLLQVPHWWGNTRRKTTWDSILAGHRSVVVNTGTTADGHKLDDEANSLMSAILLFTLRDAIQRRCSGWEAEGRSVSIFSDELSLLAGSSPEVFAWFKDQGRSFGVRPIMATQRAEQLVDQVRAAVLDFDTLVSFRINNADAAANIAKALSNPNDEWTAGDIQLLPQFTAAVRTAVDGNPQSAFTCRIDYHEDDMSTFVSAQRGTTAPAPDLTTWPEPVEPVSQPEATVRAPRISGGERPTQ